MGKNTLSLFLDKYKWLLLILLLGLGIRVFFICSQGLSNDELSALMRCRFDSWDELWFYGIKDGDMHPAFYQIFLYCWVQIFGENEFLFRASSLIFFLCNSLLIYRISVRFFNNSCGLFVLTLYSFSSFLIINTSLARPYNSGTFFLLLFVLGLFELKQEIFAKWKIFSLLFLGLIGAMVSHYFAFLAAGLFSFFGLFYLTGKQKYVLLVAGALAICAFAPHWSVTSYQLNRGGLGWLSKPDWNWLVDFFISLFNGSYWFLIGVIGLIFISYYQLKKRSIELRFLFYSVLGIYVTAHLLSLFYTPILRDIVFLFLMPFIGILMFYGVSNWRLLYQRIALVSLLTIGLFTSFRNQPIHQAQHYGEFKLLGNYINQISKKNKSIDYVFNFCDHSYINYYLSPKQKSKVYTFDAIESTYVLFEDAKNSSENEMLYAWSNFPHRAMNYEVIKRFFSRKIEYSYYFNSGLIHQVRGKRNDKVALENFNFTDSVTTLSNEFIGGKRILLKNLYEAVPTNAYLLIESKLPFKVDQSIFIVAVLENEEGMLLNEVNVPAYYMAYDKNRLNMENDCIAFSALDLPKQTKDNLYMHIYLWNPNQLKIPWGGWKFFYVN